MNKKHLDALCILVLFLFKNKEAEVVMDDCRFEVSCGKCKHKCVDYIRYIAEKDSVRNLQGDDRQPLVRRHGALGRK
jgi:tryptophanyl-tRNA synthetase